MKQAQEWLGHGDPATTLRHYVRLATAARAKAVAGFDEVTREALEAAEEKVFEDGQPRHHNVVTLASRRRWSLHEVGGARPVVRILPAVGPSSLLSGTINEYARRHGRRLPEDEVRTITVLNHLSLDGVMQAPGRPEDPRGGFEHGGWVIAGGG